MDSITGQFRIATPSDILSIQTQGDWTEASTSALDYIKNKPIRSFANVTPSLVTGTGATGTLVSAVQDAIVNYSMTIITTATIGGGASGTGVLEIAPTNSATPSDWVEIARCTNGQAITLALALQSVQTIGCHLGGVVPAGYYRKLRTINNTGTPTYTPNPGQEVLL